MDGLVGQGPWGLPAHQGQSGTKLPAATAEWSVLGKTGISSFPWLSQACKLRVLITKGFIQRGCSDMGNVNPSSGLDVSLFCP